MRSNAVPTASEPDVHAVQVGTSRPCVLKWTDRLHAVVCGISLMYVPDVMFLTSCSKNIEKRSMCAPIEPEQLP